VSVIVFIIAGFQYMTSEGDPAKTTTAKKMMIYAAIGMFIAIAAFALVNFVLRGMGEATS
jgi:hypothetical protein